jgi:hypothetical protein
MITPKIQILMALGVALGVVQAGPIDNNHGNKPTFNNKVLFFCLCALVVVLLYVFELELLVSE